MSTEKNTPKHYTEHDVKVIAYIVSWLDLNKYTQASLARLSRVSPSTLNQILKGSYPTSPTKILATTEAATRRVDEDNEQDIGVIETSVFNLVQIACSQARAYRNFAVISAYVGTGKTFALKHYVSTNANTYMIEATPTMNVNSFVKKLSQTVLGNTGKGSLDDRLQAIVDSLHNTDSLLIIDEAETLTAKQLHTIRRLRDIAGIGIVLSGTEHLRGIIQPERGQFDQIRSRCGFFPATIQEITKEDTAALVQAAFIKEEIGDDVIERMRNYCGGSARMLVEGMIAGIIKFRKDHPLNVALVDAVAKQVLCLKPIK